MSGICGLFNLDQSPVEDRDLLAMRAMLKQRGPHAANTWRDGTIGLGHTLLATTPELLTERQPFAHPPSGCAITADVRLDNRDELLQVLAPDRPPASIGDAELILLSYLTWDENCLARLLGDFAFAIWDPRQQGLFCARDHFGMRPFYYHHESGRHFVFGSSARSITVLDQVPYAINHGRIADFLVSQLEWVDYTSTFFQHIYRLPPGHKALVTASGLKITEYWEPAPGPDPGGMSDDEWREGFLDVFEQSVNDRLRAPKGTVGSMLSGGMDSGSIVAVARTILDKRGDGPLPTFSAVSGESDQSAHIECAETRAIHASIKMPNIRPALVTPKSVAQEAEFMLSGYEEPFDTDFMFFKAMYRAANELGLRVLLDGGGGDIVLSEGSYITRLLKQGRWSQAIKEVVGENQFNNGNYRSLLTSLATYAQTALAPGSVKRLLRPGKNQRQDRGYLEMSLISPDFADQVDISSRFAQQRSVFSHSQEGTLAEERAWAIRPNVTAGRERYTRIASLQGMEARDPFLDKRVVEFSANLPGHLRMRNGMAKVILRDLMGDHLPHIVAWEGRKEHLGWLFNHSVNQSLLEIGVLSLDRLQGDLREFVDTTALHKAWQTFRAGGFDDNLNRALYLSIWLQENSRRPVVSDQEIL